MIESIHCEETLIHAWNVHTTFNLVKQKQDKGLRRAQKTVASNIENTLSSPLGIEEKMALTELSCRSLKVYLYQVCMS